MQPSSPSQTLVHDQRYIESAFDTESFYRHITLSKMYKIIAIDCVGNISSRMERLLGQLGCVSTTLDNLSGGHLDFVSNPFVC